MDLSGHEGDIPTPMTSAYVATIKNTEDQATLPSNNGSGSSKKINVVVANKVVRYRECLKNHAASMGGNATDGCGEFMPSGEEGTLEALKCSACNCHRNFHRKEVEGDQPFSCHGEQLFPYGYKGALRYNMPRIHQQQQPPALIMPLGAIQSSESDEIGGDGGHGNFGFGGGMMVRAPPVSAAKKRFRTKFTQEQKEKMLGFAERVGWKLQRQEEGLVQQFCQEVGVKRRVLKVWMHNNKNSLGKKMSSNLQIQ